MLYITYNYDKDSIGVIKKIMAQCRVFQKAFENVYYATYAGHTMYLLQNGQVVDKAYALTRKMCNEAIIKWLIQYSIKRTYIRYQLSDLWFVDFLKELKELEVKSVLEFPTIPYDKEGGIRRPLEDKYYREQLHQYIECCTTYANYDKVFDIPCISLVNGVDINEHRIKNAVHKNTGDITLIAVATMRREHGYERIIRGMYEYYRSGGKRKIYFNLVGDGSQLPYYKQLVNEWQLEKYVFFHGFLQGKELDRVYDASDIGIGALGIYKSGIFEGTGIKAVEYCIRGLPLVMTNDYGFKDKYYVLKVSNNDTPIDMDSVIAFYDSLQERDYISDMHNYAVENYSWDKILEPVIEYLKTD